MSVMDLHDIKTVIEEIIKRSPLYTIDRVRDTVANIEEILNFIEDNKHNCLMRSFSFIFNDEPVVGLELTYQTESAAKELSPQAGPDRLYIVYYEKINIPSLVTAINLIRVQKLPRYVVHLSSDREIVLLKNLEAQLHYINEFLVQPLVNLITKNLDLPITIAIEYIMPQVYKELAVEMVKSMPPDEYERLKNRAASKANDNNSSGSSLKEEFPEPNESLKAQKFTR